MKQTKVQVEKAQCRANIEVLRGKIRAQLFDLKKIPQQVVDGSFDDVVNFKDDCERSSALYHVKHQPGNTLTLKELREVEVRLGGLAKKLFVQV